ncbi:MAG TPA: EAL domain-containing protein [Micropepsaceae bacterium]|nr:EAL domain-containing protein [Micropepsaceae bacterium]
MPHLTRFMVYAAAQTIDVVKRNRAGIQSAIFLTILALVATGHMWELKAIHGTFGVISFQTMHSLNLVETLLTFAVFIAGLLVFITYRAEHRIAAKRCLAAEWNVHRQALEDGLTGLPNRRYFEDALGTALTSPVTTGGLHAVFLLGLNDFKRVNDLYGHPTGDQALCQVANRLRNAVSGGDVVARFGGDEFAVLSFHLTGLDAATAIAGRIATALAQPIVVGSSRLLVSAAIGIVLLPFEGATTQEVLREADVALFHAKGETGPGYRYFEAGMDRALREFDLLERELRKAIDADEIRPFYQPEVDLASNAIVGFEALARWTHPTMGEIEPATFIPVAEKSGLINALSLRLLRQVCLETKTWPDHLQISFNVSPLQLRDRAHGQELLQVLNETGFPAHRLEIEITENALVSDIEAVRTTLGLLRQAGAKVALDDFGTGSSNLFHLRSFTPDKIKIDRSFVGTMMFDKGSEMIIRALIGLGLGLGVAVTAEGIETYAQQLRLRTLGCPLGQGFLFSRAVPATAATQMIAANADGLTPAAAPYASGTSSVLH